MRKFKRTVVTIVSLFCVAASGSENNRDRHEVHIGLASNFSEVSQSSSNPFGDYFRNGVQLALANFEKRLEKKNIKVHFDEFDYGTSQLRVLDAAKKANSSEVIAVVGYNWSSFALLAAPLHQNAGLPMLTPSATADRIGKMGAFVHMASFDNGFMGATLAKVGRQRLKGKTAAMVVAEDCAYCHDLADGFALEFKRLGGQINIRAAISESQQDFKDIVASIKKNKPEIILIPNYELTSARVITALIESGVNVPFLGGDGWGNVGEQFFKLLNGQNFTAYSVSHWHPEIKNAISNEFVKQYSTKFGKEPNDTAVLAYDSTSIILTALLSLKKFSRAAVEKELLKARVFDGVTGKFRFNERGGAPEKSIVLMRNEASQFKVVERIDPKRGGSH